MSRNYQAVTNAGIRKRLDDTELEELTDKRGRRGRQIPHRARVNLLAFAAMADEWSLRDVEEFSRSLAGNHRRSLRLRREAISYSTVRTTLDEVDWRELPPCLRRQVYQEHRRGNLEPPDWLPFGAVAVDGKCTGIVEPDDHELVQNVDPDDKETYGKIMAHRATLVSSDAKVCVGQRPIPGDTNEIGAMPAMIDQLRSDWGRTSLFELVMADAGNCSLEVADAIKEAGWAYYFRLKKNQTSLHREAVRRLGGDDEILGGYEFGGGEREAPGEPEATWRDRSDGKDVRYRMWRAEWPAGYLDWGHARQVIRIERRRYDSDGELQEVGNRYFVTSLAPDALTKPVHWIRLTRRYWGCENGNHWTCDVIFGEDAEQTPWAEEPGAIVVATYIRLIAVNILAVLRQMSRHGSQGIPKWQTVADYAYTVGITGTNPTVGVCD